MQHYKTVQQRFSAVTMNSDDKLAEKEKEKQAATAGAVRLAAPLELPPPRANGLVANGRGSGSGLPNGYVSPDEDRPNLINEETAADEKEEEEEKARRRRAKGKGKARAD